MFAGIQWPSKMDNVSYQCRSMHHACAETTYYVPLFVGLYSECDYMTDCMSSSFIHTFSIHRCIAYDGKRILSGSRDE